MRNMLLAGILLLALILAFSSAFVVYETEQVIILQFGKPVGQPITKAGLHFRLPLLQDVRRFDKRYLEWDGQRNEVPTADKRFIWVDTYARWQITDPLLFYERLRDEAGARRRLDDLINGETRNAIANHNLVEAVRGSNRQPQQDASRPEESGTLETIEVGREKIRQQIVDNVQATAHELGISVLDVQIKRINYVQEVREKVEDRMIAERQRIAARFRSEGEGEAARIRGEKERELKRIVSEAYRQSEEIRGRADAQATEIYAQAYNQNPQTRELYAFLKSLETYKSTFDPQTTLILSTDSDLFKYLKKSEP